MSLTNDQKHQINKLIDYRDQIVEGLFHIERILKTYFPEEFERAIQFYIPQITTALYEDKKWLSRGEYSLQNTIDNLMMRCKSIEDNKNITKYLQNNIMDYKLSEIHQEIEHIKEYIDTEICKKCEEMKQSLAKCEALLEYLYNNKQGV